MTEQCWALTGGFDEKREHWLVHLHRNVSGEPSSVEADWQWAMKLEEDSGNLAGFAHTHPDGAGTKPSARDVRTMQAWCIALGKPLLCIIGEGETLEQADAYVFDDESSAGEPTKAFTVIDN